MSAWLSVKYSSDRPCCWLFQEYGSSLWRWQPVEWLRFEPLLDRKELLTFIGPPIEVSFARYYELNEDELKQVAAKFRKIYCQDNLFKAALYDGMEEVFKYLDNRNIRMAIATYKRESYTIPLLKHFQIDRYTDIIFGSDAEGKLKKNDIIRKCIEKAGCTDLSKVVMIGDTRHDGEGAGQLGIHFVAVTYGFGFQRSEEYADLECMGVVDRPLELISCIDKFIG